MNESVEPQSGAITQTQVEDEFEELDVESGPTVGIVMGSKSDMPAVQKAADELTERGIHHELRVMSAHRDPDTRPIAIAGSLASERRSRGWGRAVDGPPCRLNAVRENGNPAVRLLAVTLRADAGLLLERDVDNPSLVGLHRVHHDPLTRAPDPISQPERHFLDRLFTPVSVVLDVDHQPAPVRSTLVEDQVDDRLERP